jgi:hypothetical protein
MRNVMTDDAQSPVSPAWQMNRLIWGAMQVPAISAVAALGIADLLAGGPRTAEDLARTTNTHPPTLRRLLRAVATLAIFAEDASGAFVNTPLSDTLRRDNPASVRPLAMMWGSPLFRKPWENLPETLATGEAAFDRVFGEPFFERLRHDADDAAVFNAAMGSLSGLELPAILAAYDFSRFRRLVDVGGGRGALLQGILTATPGLHGVLYDLAAVVADDAGLAGPAASVTWEIVAGNFFESVPSGADAYVLKRIIHDWNDADALRILANCRRAIREDGTLILIECVLRPPNEPDLGKWMDLHMLLILGGRERTESEYRALLEKGGFALTRVIPISGVHSIIESKPIPVRQDQGA